MDYLNWNDQLAAHFFNTKSAGCRVRLYVTEALVNEIGTPSNAGLADFIAGIQTGPPWVTKSQLCSKAKQSWYEWRSRSLQYPPYLAYLAFFALAAGREGEFISSAYYPRLRELLGEAPVSGTYPHFEQMLDLWADLERWANLDQHERLGLFTADVAGNRIHVGLPIAQTILTEDERQALPTLFAQAGFDPLAPPNSQTLAARLAAYGRTLLRPRTLRTLRVASTKATEERDWLLGVIAEELHDWDGAVIPQAAASEKGERFAGALRLCLALDRIAGHLTVTLRCRTNRDFPPGGFRLKSETGEFICEEAALGWSTALVCLESERELDASLYDWAAGLQMVAEQWSFTLSDAPVRIFVHGAPDDLSGLVECPQLPTSGAFYLAARAEHRALLERWGAAGCRGFREIAIHQGLPSGWRFFTVEAVQSDELVREQLPMLALPSTLRLEFEGGLRVSRGNRFFGFAPPSVRLIGGMPDSIITCNGIRLSESATLGLYSLPVETLAQNDLLIEAPAHKVSRWLFLADEAAQVMPLPQAVFGRFGERLVPPPQDSSYLSGAVLTNCTAPAFTFHTLTEVQGERRVYFIGRQPGQIVTWPAEPLPADWHPVWAVPLRQQGKAIFCGTSLAAARPLPAVNGDRKKLKCWKEVLWHSRKRIAPPAHKELSALWRQFQQEAQRV